MFKLRNIIIIIPLFTSIYNKLTHLEHVIGETAMQVNSLIPQLLQCCWHTQYSML